MKIVFSGGMGRLPVGGWAAVHVHYLAGLQALGHEVVYLEECGSESWVYDWESEEVTTSLEYPAKFLNECLTTIGMSQNWIYRAGEDAAGMPREQFQEFCSQADLFIVYGVPLACWRPEYLLPRRRAFIDVDPGFIQIDLHNGHKELTETVDRCEVLFTIGQRFGAADCQVPVGGRQWLTTVAPVFMDHWGVGGLPATHFTTVMQWRGFREVTYDGVVYGQKDREFPNFIDLPRRTPQPFRLAITGAPPGDLEANGWDIVPGWIASRTLDSYRSFVQSSRAEFSVAKHGYVRMRAGWFSDRSTCYLASGKPALVQDTGLADWLPVGEGIVTFRNIDEAVQGIERINSDYARHCRAARQIAEEYFATDRVLPALLHAAT